MDYTAIFERVEMKYVLTESQYTELMAEIRDHIQPDVYPHSEITSIYFDSDTYQLARTSTANPAYKEKLRLRSYCTEIKDDSPVFLELKKKYHGVTYKRRQDMTYRQAMDYLLFDKMPCNSQIMQEIDYTRKKYGNLNPKVLIAYSRDSYAGVNCDLRLTFDSQIGYNLVNLNMKNSRPDSQLTSGEIIMEVKTASSMPLWLSETLNRLHIYPGNFSKYGKIYQEKINRGGKSCSTYYSRQYSHLHLTAPVSSYAH